MRRRRCQLQLWGLLGSQRTVEIERARGFEFLGYQQVRPSCNSVSFHPSELCNRTEEDFDYNCVPAESSFDLAAAAWDDMRQFPADILLILSC